MSAPAYLLERGFDAATIDEVGWRVDELGPDWKRYGLPDASVAHELVLRIPYRRNGRVEYERIRFVETNPVGGRYRGPKGSKLMPYDPWGAVLGDEGVAVLEGVLAIEGEANAVSVHVAGFDDMPIVGLPGHQMTKGIASELGGASVVYQWLDPGGQYRRNAERLYAAGVGEVYALETTDTDANDILVERGPAALLELVRERVESAELVEPDGRVRPLQRPVERRTATTSGDLVVPLLLVMREYVLLTDPDPVLAALGCAVASVLEGDPVWVLLVGGPSCGKTETIDVLHDVADGKIKALTGPGLLSWKGGKKPHPVGLLARLGDGSHFATITDLSSLLAKSERGGRDDAFALLRDAYDGDVIRDLGTIPEPLHWSGRLTLLGAATPAVDQYASHQDALGPRWAYLRLPELGRDNGKRAASMAYARASAKSDAQARARAYAREAVEQARARIDPDAGSADAETAIIAAARLGARGRSVVPREAYGQRDVCGDPVIEEPMRLVGQARALYVGVLALGVPDAVAQRVACRLALDGMPPVRRKVLAKLVEGVANTTKLARDTGSHHHVTTRALEDLAVLGLVTELDERGMFGERNWQLHDAYLELARAALKGVARDVAYPPPSPPSSKEVAHTSCHPLNGRGGAS
jgi:hypothetical protein